MENSYKIDLVKSSESFNKTYEDIDFVINATTKEQYLAFKEFIKSKKYHTPHEYLAYYMFKHRIGCDFENEELVDDLALKTYLDSAIINQYWKMLWHGKQAWIYGGGEGCMKYEAIPKFQKAVINCYNKFATLNNKK